MQSVRFNTIPSPEDSRDYHISIKNSEPLPDTFSMRDLMKRVRNQGDIGSCVAMSAAAMKEYHEYVDIGESRHMSPMFVYNTRRNYPAPGMFLRDAMKILQKRGICLEKECPYSQQNPSGISEAARISALNYRIKSYARIHTVLELKNSLRENGPSLICFPVYRQFGKIWEKSGTSGICNGYHCMTVVGWNKDGFEIRNSWGAIWDFDGHITYPYDDWGVHTEIWTSVDNDSIRKDSIPFFRRLLSIIGCI